MKFRTALAVALIAVSAPTALAVSPAFAGTATVVRSQSSVAQLEQAAADARATYEAVLAKETAREQELVALLSSGELPEAIRARRDAATAAVQQAKITKADAERVRSERSAAIDALPATTTEDERVAAFRELHRADLAAKAAADALAGAERELAAAVDQGDDWRVEVTRQVGRSRQAVADALAASQAADRALAEARAAEAQQPTPTPVTPAESATATPTPTPTSPPAPAVDEDPSDQAEDRPVTASVIPSAVPTPVPSAAPVGELAATGSSASPVFAVAGAAALALGAGAVLVARRRKDDADR